MNKVKNENCKTMHEITNKTQLENIFGGESQLTTYINEEKPDKPTPIKRKPKRSGVPAVDL
ncbi:hypothetical protein Q4574_20635 [Aliiglaciecola sp. 3_MG-2023]|uniref:hypothetical protein n=1 Tax=Aliiglaciecola sp. 3_MG-2023 TaxID=3062644 RepID=UPI0026E27534|nr:hypothetical protein [Aliiglaciecola sp. 3_MG-2023]MDO6695718.1 hypothetical protein [Aliiglaciecola sp. 3_MG-2023]